MNNMEEFINSQRKPKTKEYYRWCLSKYFDAIKASPDNYLTSGRNFEKDIQTFVRYMEPYAPTTQHNFVSCVRTFFMVNDIEFKKSFWMKPASRPVDGGVLTIDRKPEREELRRMMSYADLKLKCLITFNHCSGMRIDETLRLKVGDVDFKTDPVMITIPSTIVKGRRQPRVTFITTECASLLKEWLEVRPYTYTKKHARKKETFTVNESERDRFLRIACSKSNFHKKNPDDDRLFPWSKAMTRIWLYKIMEKAGCNKRCKETNMYELHFHTGRKYVESQLKTVIPEVIVEALVGHKKYLSEAYHRYSPKELGAFYKKGEPLLTIMGEMTDLSGVNEDLKELRRQKIQQDQEIFELRKLISELGEKKLNELKEREKN